MSSTFDDTNSGVLFKNDKVTGPNSPTYRGHSTVQCPCCGNKHKFWLSSWVKTAKNMTKYMSLAFTPDDPSVNAKRNTNTPMPDDITDDDIPFN